MSPVKAVLFDLDGTLSDPKVGLIKSYMHTFQTLGIAPPSDPAVLTKFIGPPLRDVFRQHYNLNSDDTEHAVAVFREYFAVNGLYENTVYPGVEEMLHTLKTSGISLYVATNKVISYAKTILDHFNLLSYFHFVSGTEMNGERATKTEVITHALETCGMDPQTAVMVGDREHDMIGARQTGLTAIGVLYGYGSREELESAGADYLASTPAEVVSLLTHTIKIKRG